MLKIRIEYFRSPKKKAYYYKKLFLRRNVSSTPINYVRKISDWIFKKALKKALKKIIFNHINISIEFKTLNYMCICMQINLPCNLKRLLTLFFFIKWKKNRAISFNCERNKKKNKEKGKRVGKMKNEIK